jgi:membrane dipeptidase
MKTVQMVLMSCLLAAFAGAVQAEAGLEQQAAALARDSLIVDTHIDVPYRIHESWEDVTRATGKGEFDFPRARAGGLNVPFMSIYTPAAMEAKGGSFQLANELIDSVEAMVARAPGEAVLVRTPADAEEALRSGRIGLAMGMENGSPLEHDLANIRHFRDRGISYITLAHSLSNHLSDSSYDDNRPLGGLSDFGREAVREMNRLGVMVDISHVSDDAFYQVLEITQAPVIASHSSARHFTPGFERNMSDDMISALARTGGVIQINFGSSFLTEEARAWSDEYWKQREHFTSSNGLEGNSEAVAQFSADYRAKSPFPFARLEHVLDHIDHVVKLVGVDHVGIGSDYDGVGDSLPTGLKDVSTFPNLIAGLLERGYSEEQIRKILGGNLLRVWRQVQGFAEARTAD